MTRNVLPLPPRPSPSIAHPATCDCDPCAEARARRVRRRADTLAELKPMREAALIESIMLHDPDAQPDRGNLEFLHAEFGYGLSDCDCDIEYTRAPCGDDDCDGDCTICRPAYCPCVGWCGALLLIRDHGMKPHEVVSCSCGWSGTLREARRDLQSFLKRIKPCRHSLYTGWRLPVAAAQLVASMLWPDDYAEPRQPPARDEEMAVRQREAYVGVMQRRFWSCRICGTEHDIQGDEQAGTEKRPSECRNCGGPIGFALRRAGDSCRTGRFDWDAFEQNNVCRVGILCPVAGCHARALVCGEEARCPACAWSGTIWDLDRRQRNGTDGRETMIFRRVG